MDVLNIITTPKSTSNSILLLGTFFSFSCTIWLLTHKRFFLWQRRSTTTRNCREYHACTVLYHLWHPVAASGCIIQKKVKRPFCRKLNIEYILFEKFFTILHRSWIMCQKLNFLAFTDPCVDSSSPEVGWGILRGSSGRDPGLTCQVSSLHYFLYLQHFMANSTVLLLLIGGEHGGKFEENFSNIFKNFRGIKLC